MAAHNKKAPRGIAYNVPGTHDVCLVSLGFLSKKYSLKQSFYDNNNLANMC